MPPREGRLAPQGIRESREGWGGPLRLALVGAAAALLLAAGCGRHGKEAPVGGSTVPPSQTRLQRSVEVARVESRSLDIFVETVGYLEPEGQTDIAAGVPGLVDEVLCREGQWVDRDTILVKVDQRRYQALLAQAEANVKKAEANVKKAEANVEKTEAAHDYAQKTLALKETQYRIAAEAKAGVSRQELEERDADVKLARSRLKETKSDIEVAKADVGAAGKEAEAARAMLQLAERNLALSRVRAPYAGQINQRKVTPGSFLEDKTVIATMADLTRLRLVGWIPEKAAGIVRAKMEADQVARAAALAGVLLSDPTGLVSLSALHLESRGGLQPPEGFTVEFTLLPYPKVPLRGRVFYLSTVANPETHMFECKAEVETGGKKVELKPGYMARIRAPIRSNPDTLVIPEEAVRASERGFIAFVPQKRPTRDGKEEWVAVAKPVQLGYRSGIGRDDELRDKKEDIKPGMVEVLGGLNKGDWIVGRGAEALEDGTPIAIPAAQLEQLAGPR